MWISQLYKLYILQTVILFALRLIKTVLNCSLGTMVWNEILTIFFEFPAWVFITCLKCGAHHFFQRLTPTGWNEMGIYQVTALSTFYKQISHIVHPLFFHFIIICVSCSDPICKHLISHLCHSWCKQSLCDPTLKVCKLLFLTQKTFFLIVLHSDL